MKCLDQKLHFWTRHCNTSSLAKEKQLFKQIKASQQADVVDYSSQYSREEELDNSVSLNVKRVSVVILLFCCVFKSEINTIIILNESESYITF